MIQKSDLIRSKKWAMEDAFLREVGASLSGSTSMRSWDEPWEISTKNRDRPGGHQAARYYHQWKKADKRKARREHRKIIADAVRDFYEDHELYLQEMAALYDDFWDDMIAYDNRWWDDFKDDYDHLHYFEDDYDPFWDDYDPFWDLCYLD